MSTIRPPSKVSLIGSLEHAESGDRDRAVDHADALRAGSNRRDVDLAARQVPERSAAGHSPVVDQPRATLEIEGAVRARRCRDADVLPPLEALDDRCGERLDGLVVGRHLVREDVLVDLGTERDARSRLPRPLVDRKAMRPELGRRRRSDPEEHGIDLREGRDERGVGRRDRSRRAREHGHAHARPDRDGGVAHAQAGIDERFVDEHGDPLARHDAEAPDRVDGPHGQGHLGTSSGSATRPSRRITSPSRSRPSSVAAS